MHVLRDTLQKLVSPWAVALIAVTLLVPIQAASAAPTPSTTTSASTLATAAAIPLSSPVRVASPCHWLYYKGTATHPTQAQLACKDHTVLFRINGPFPRDVNRHQAGIHVYEVLFVSDELRVFYDTPHRYCYAIRDLRIEGPADGDFVCYRR